MKAPAKVRSYRLCSLGRDAWVVPAAFSAFVGDAAIGYGRSSDSISQGMIELALLEGGAGNAQVAGGLGNFHFTYRPAWRRYMAGCGPCPDGLWRDWRGARHRLAATQAFDKASLRTFRARASENATHCDPDHDAAIEPPPRWLTGVARNVRRARCARELHVPPDFELTPTGRPCWLRLPEVRARRKSRS